MGCFCVEIENILSLTITALFTSNASRAEKIGRCHALGFDSDYLTKHASKNRIFCILYQCLFSFFFQYSWL